jgi:phosphate transport system substrate-binding protein
LLLSVGLVAPLSGAELRVTGSDLLGTEFAAVVRDFAQRSESALVLSLDGSRGGFARLRNGEADVGLIVAQPDQPLAEDGFRRCALGYHVVVVLVPAALPLTQIALPDLAAIYGAAAGASHAHWGELGLTGEWAIRTIEPEAMAGGHGLSLELFRELALHGGELKAAVVLQPSAEALVRKLAGGDTGIALASAPPAEGEGVKVLPVAATVRDIACAPTPEHVHGGGYPLRLPVWLVVRREAAKADLEFLQFLLGDEVARALEHAGLVTLPRPAREELKYALERW